MYRFKKWKTCEKKRRKESFYLFIYLSAEGNKVYLKIHLLLKKIGKIRKPGSSVLGIHCLTFDYLFIIGIHFLFHLRRLILPNMVPMQYQNTKKVRFRYRRRCTQSFESQNSSSYIPWRSRTRLLKPAPPTSITENKTRQCTNPNHKLNNQRKTGGYLISPRSRRHKTINIKKRASQWC